MSIFYSLYYIVLAVTDDLYLYILLFMFSVQNWLCKSSFTTHTLHQSVLCNSIGRETSAILLRVDKVQTILGQNWLKIGI